MPAIEVTVSPEGHIRLETQGFRGATCQDASRALEAALGLVQSDEKTAAYYQNFQQETPVAILSEARA